MMESKPYRTYITLGCWKCFDGPTPRNNIPLHRCGGCKRVVYCGSQCQRDDWADHKQECKVLLVAERTFQFTRIGPIGFDERPNQYSSQIENLNYHAKAQSLMKAMGICVLAEGIPNLRQANMKNLAGFEPRCLACIRTAPDIRTEEARGIQFPRALRSCDACRSSFYCSDEHFNSAHHAHSEIPYEDGHDNLSQCQMNAEYWWASIVEYDLLGTRPAMLFVYPPGSFKSTWISLKGMSWESELWPLVVMDIESGVREVDNPISRAFYHRHSDILTVPMTILFALEHLNKGDDTWTKKKVLVIHFLGADFEEFARSHALHEIFHRLPDLREIQFLLCGPSLQSWRTDSSFLNVEETAIPDITNCTTCYTRKNKFVRTVAPTTYHDWVQQQGAAYVQPDLAVAFNSGCGIGLETQAIEYQFLDWTLPRSTSWRDTERLLVQKHIPTLFTANNPDDALKDEQRLIAAGAKFVPGLERCRNPWGSMLTRQRRGMVRGFQSFNRWIVGGFK